MLRHCIIPLIPIYHESEAINHLSESVEQILQLESNAWNIVAGDVKGKWQQNFLSSYLKETPKQYIEVYYRIFISALFGEIF